MEAGMYASNRGKPNKPTMSGQARALEQAGFIDVAYETPINNQQPLPQTQQMQQMPHPQQFYQQGYPPHGVQQLPPQQQQQPYMNMAPTVLQNRMMYLSNESQSQYSQPPMRQQMYMQQQNSQSLTSHSQRPRRNSNASATSLSVNKFMKKQWGKFAGGGGSGDDDDNDAEGEEGKVLIDNDDEEILFDDLQHIRGSRFGGFGLTDTTPYIPTIQTRIGAKSGMSSQQYRKAQMAQKKKKAADYAKMQSQQPQGPPRSMSLQSYGPGGPIGPGFIQRNGTQMMGSAGPIPNTMHMSNPMPMQYPMGVGLQPGSSGYMYPNNEANRSMSLQTGSNPNFRDPRSMSLQNGMRPNYVMRSQNQQGFIPGRTNFTPNGNGGPQQRSKAVPQIQQQANALTSVTNVSKQKNSTLIERSKNNSNDDELNFQPLIQKKTTSQLAMPVKEGENFKDHKNKELNTIDNAKTKTKAKFSRILFDNDEEDEDSISSPSVREEINILQVPQSSPENKTRKLTRDNTESMISTSSISDDQKMNQKKIYFLTNNSTQQDVFYSAKELPYSESGSNANSPIKNFKDRNNNNNIMPAHERKASDISNHKLDTVSTAMNAIDDALNSLPIVSPKISKSSKFLQKNENIHNVSMAEDASEGTKPLENLPSLSLKSSSGKISERSSFGSSNIVDMDVSLHSKKHSNATESATSPLRTVKPYNGSLDPLSSVEAETSKKLDDADTTIKSDSTFTPSQYGLLNDNTQLFRELQLVSNELASSISREISLEDSIRTTTPPHSATFDSTKRASEISELAIQLSDERRKRYAAEELLLSRQMGSPVEKQLTDVSYKNSKLEKRILDLQEDKNLQNTRIEMLQAENQALDTELSDLNKKYKVLNTSVVPKLKSQIEMFESMRSNNNELELLRSENEQLRDMVRDLETDHEEAANLRDQMRELREALRRMKTEKEGYEQKCNILEKRMDNDS